MLRWRASSALLALLLSAACSAQAPGADSASAWHGTLEPPAPPLAVTVELRARDGVEGGMIHVPEDRVLRPLADLQFGPERVAFAFPTVDGEVSYEGRRAGDVVTGTFGRGDRRAPLVLRRLPAPPEEPPYQELVVPVAGGTRVFTASLFRPRGSDRTPAVVLLHGTGGPTVDDLRFFADLFARRGIAALAYDKRDTCGEYGWRSCIDLRDLAADGAAAWSALRARADIDPARIGFFGFSEGGWVAPLAAAEVGQAAFVVNASGSCVSYAELNRHINAERLRRDGFGEEDVAELLAALDRVDRYVRTGEGAAETEALLASLSARPWLTATNLGSRLPTQEEIASLLRWRCLDLDPSPSWEALRCPVLAVFGAQDEMIPVAESAGRIEAATARGGSAAVVRIVPGANHALQPGTAALDEAVEWVAQRMATAR